MQQAEGSSDTQSFFGFSYATPFGFYPDGIPLWTYFFVSMFYIFAQIWMAWIQRLADKIEDEAMNIARATKQRAYKAFQFTTYNTLIMISTQFLVLQISRPNVIFILALYIGSIMGNLIAMNFMEREVDVNPPPTDVVKKTKLKRLVEEILREHPDIIKHVLEKNHVK